MLLRQLTTLARTARHVQSLNECCKQTTNKAAPVFIKKHSFKFYSTEAKTEETSTETATNEETSKLEKEIEQLKKDVADYKDRYQRSLAESENIRMRLKKEIDNAKLFGIQSFCKDLLNVADIMQFATKSVSEEQVQEETNELWRSFHEGVCMTEKELHKVFGQHGLVTMQPEIGDKFNPNDHEALFEVPLPNMEAGMIAHVERAGYQLKGRTLRPARVGVSRK